MKVLLTGASGILGGALQQICQLRNWTCNPLDRLEFFKASQAQRILTISGYDWVIHAAANTNVEACEQDPEACYRDNYLLTEILAQACAKEKVKLGFISSTGIYGTHGSAPYREYDAVMPTTHHHRSKWLAEQSVLACSHLNLIIRTGWLFGGRTDNPKNFVIKRAEEALRIQQDGGVIKSNNEQRGVPCFNIDIADRLIQLMSENLSGIFNCVSSGSASRLEYVSEIISLAGIDIAVEPISASAFSRHARVSDNEMAENWKMTELGMQVMPDWKNGLARYVQQILPYVRPKQ